MQQRLEYRNKIMVGYEYIKNVRGSIGILLLGQSISFLMAFTEDRAIIARMGWYYDTELKMSFLFHAV